MTAFRVFLPTCPRRPTFRTTEMTSYRKLSSFAMATVLPLMGVMNPALGNPTEDLAPIAATLAGADRLTDEEMHELRGGIRNNRLSLGISFEEFTVINDQLVAHRASG